MMYFKVCTTLYNIFFVGYTKYFAFFDINDLELHQIKHKNHNNWEKIINVFGSPSTCDYLSKYGH
jgi:hypothetical protein